MGLFAKSPIGRARPALAAGAPAVLALLALLVVCGCKPPVKSQWPEPGTVTPRLALLRGDHTGPIILAFVEQEIDPRSPAEGLRLVIDRAIAGRPSASAALFPWDARDQAREWLTGQVENRRETASLRVTDSPAAEGAEEIRLLLLGHGLGGAEAGEMARWALQRFGDLRIELLATVDAVKNGAVSRPVGLATAMVNQAAPLPGVDLNFIAYNGAPRVDGRRLRAHVNYYQEEDRIHHGAPMAGASENHRLQGVNGSLAHENADQHAAVFLASDLAIALR